MSKKILVISLKTGWGHIKAAQALEEYAKENLPDFKITHINLGQMEPLLGKFFEKFYDIANDHLPTVWGTVYEAFDKEPVSVAFRKMGGFQRMFKRRVSSYLKKQDVDGIIFTNVAPAPMVAPACREIFPHVPLAVVVTDYHGHSYYNIPAIDRYFVAIPEVKDDLVRVGIADQKIAVTGMPVSQKFYASYDKARLKKRLGFSNNAKTVLFISRLSKDFVVPAIEKLLAMDETTNLVMVCGGNNELYRKIKEEIPPRQNLKLLNWTNRIDEYMKISDVIVSKPGGLVISECLALGKPIVMTDPIPGQEERNAEFMAKHDYGTLASGPDQIVGAVRRCLFAPETAQNAAIQPNPCAEILKYFK